MIIFLNTKKYDICPLFCLLKNKANTQKTLTNLIVYAMKHHAYADVWLIQV